MDVPDKPSSYGQRYDMAERLERQAGQLHGVKKKRSLEFIDDKSICHTCSRASIYRRGSKNASVIQCGEFGAVPNDIEECNRHSAVTELSLDQMAQIAVLLDQRDLLRGGYL